MSFLCKVLEWQEVNGSLKSDNTKPGYDTEESFSSVHNQRIHFQADIKYYYYITETMISN